MQTETNSLAMQTNLYSESAKKHQKLHDTYLGLQSHKNLNAINDKKNIYKISDGLQYFFRWLWAVLEVQYHVISDT